MSPKFVPFVTCRVESKENCIVNMSLFCLFVKLPLYWV
jgi:hypothetical protein